MWGWPHRRVNAPTISTAGECHAGHTTPLKLFKGTVRIPLPAAHGRLQAPGVEAHDLYTQPHCPTPTNSVGPSDPKCWFTHVCLFPVAIPLVVKEKTPVTALPDTSLVNTNMEHGTRNTEVLTFRPVKAAR